jgi:AhpD family alkylhydroperoxidase
LKSRLGVVLNIHGEMAHAPAVISMYKAMGHAIAEDGTFDAQTREAIALAVGNQDGCDYCQSAHTVSARRAGFTVEQTIAIRDGHVGFDDKLAALLAVAREIAANVGEVSDAAYERALAEGWAEPEMAELFAHVATNIFTNYFNHYARTELDIPAASGVARNAG